MKANKEIRSLMAENHITMWQIGNVIGRNEITICRWFRTELSDEKKDLVLNAITSILNNEEGRN